MFEAFRAVLRTGAHFLGAALACILLARAAEAQVSLTLGDATLAAGESGSVTASIATDGSAVALQFDVLYDPAVLSLGTVNGGGALTGSHSIASNPIAPGRDRVVITTAPVTALAGGVLASFNLAVAASAGAGTATLTFDGVVISDAAAQPVTPSSLTPGTITITAGAGVPPEPEAIPASPLWALLLLVALLMALARHHAPRRRLAATLPLLFIACAGLLVPAAQAQNRPGDANNDGRIDAEDVRLIVERILERGVLPGDGDCNRDARINVLDTVCSQLPFVEGATAPIILGPGDRSIPAGSPFAMNLFAADPDPGSSFTWELLSGPAGLSVAPGGELAWAPTAGDVGANAVSVRVTDNTDRRGEATFAIAVFAEAATAVINTPPRLSVPASQSLPVGTPLAAQASATDPDVGDIVTFTLVNGPAGMTIDAATGALAWTPQPDQARTADVAIEATDAAGASAVGSFQVTAVALNAGPTAQDDVYIARKGETLAIPAPQGVLTNDTDPNGDLLLASRLSDPALGTVDGFGADGSFSYTPSEPEGITIGLELKCESNRADFSSGAGTMAAADVDGDDDVELAGLIPTQLGAQVVVLDPLDCSATVNAVPAESGQPSSDTLSTLVNLDDDPELEVVAQYNRFADDLPANGPGDTAIRLLGFNLDGTPIEAWPDFGLSEHVGFETGFNQEWQAASPVAVDLEGNGNVALLAGFAQVGPQGLAPGTCRAIASGTSCNAVVAWDGQTGEVLWQFVGGVTRPNQRSLSPTIVDLDMDGDTEIIWNQLVLDHEGNLLFELPVERTLAVANFELYGNDMLTVAIGNFDSDAFPEIVGYDATNFYLFSHDGAIQWQRPYNAQGFDFPWADLTLAELDGDPFPELVTMLEADGGAALTLRAFDSDGMPLWDIADEYVVAGFSQTRSSSPVAFDLDGDGIDELIQLRANSATGADDGWADAGLYIYDGASGNVIAAVQGRTTNVVDEPLTVADIDGDGSAEIVTTLVDNLAQGDIQIWDNLPGEPFPPARPIRSQTNVQPTWVNVDGSLPRSLEPHWLQPGRNYWNRIVPDRDPLEPEQDSFIYRISDGEFDSAPATVNIEIRPNGNPPFFLSEPKRGTSAGIPYRYSPLVTDIDPGDTVTFELLNGPAGMSIDAATGEVDWYPQSNGDYPVTIAATDTLGLSSAQIFTVTVGEPAEVPDLIGLTENAADSALSGVGLALGSRFIRSDPVVPAGEVLGQNPPGGSVAELGSAVQVTLSNGPTQADTDSDGDGFTPNDGDCDDDSASVYPGGPEIDGDGIDQSCNGIDGNKTLVAIEVTPTERRLLTGQPQPLRAMGIFEDGTAQDLTKIASWTRGPTFSSASAGDFSAEASFQGVIGSADFEVVDRVDEDLAPIARIISPDAGGEVTAPTTVIGTATDANLLRWELAYRYAGEDEFVVFAEDTAGRTSLPLADFDPTLLLNGLYTLRLRVFDAGGNVSEDRTTVEVDGRLKVGNFSLRFPDLDIPMAGVPLRVVRTYDSRDKRRSDFGVGWSLDINTPRLSVSRELGSGWRVLRSGLSYSLVPTDVHAVSLTLSDGRVEVFDLVVTPNVSPVVPFPPLTQEVSYRPREGTLGRMESLEDNNISILDPQPGPATLRLDNGGAVYDPSLFLYTALDGTRIEIHRTEGVRSITDPNGNVLTLGPGGITHSAGKSISITRDALGRITQITDPNGDSQSYRYDANGDLRGHTDALGVEERYSYNGSHGLISITDGRGNTILTNSFDGDGRVTATFDAAGNRTGYQHDLVARTSVVTDPRGQEYFFAYDERGNIIRSADALGNESISTYDEAGNVTSHTNPLGEVTRFEYDEHNRETRRSNGEGHASNYSYDASGRLATVSDPKGNVTQFERDARGNVTRMIDPLGNTTRYAYDRNGNLVASTDARGSTTRYEYNAFGNVIRETDSSGTERSYTYDNNGRRLTASVDIMQADGTMLPLTISRTRDGRGNVLQLSDNLGHSASTSYDANGQPLTNTNVLGQTSGFTYNANGLLTRTTLADGSTYTRRYTADNQVAETVGPDGRVTEMGYTESGLPNAMIDENDPANPADDASRSLSYDAANRLTALGGPTGTQRGYRYDASGRIIATSIAGTELYASTLDASGEPVAITDANGGVTSFTLDALNRPVERRLPGGRVINTSYDGNGNVVEISEIDGESVSFSYDSLNRLGAVEIDGTKTVYTRDNVGRLLSATDGLGRETRFAYSLGETNTLFVTRPLGQQKTATYDALGNLLRVDNPDGTFIEYEYDALNRRTSKILSSGETTAYEYTADGKPTRVSGPDGATRLLYNAQGLLRREVDPNGFARDYEYDKAGRITAVTTQSGTTRYGYDDSGRLIGVTDLRGRTTTYTYDRLGNLLEKALPNGTTELRSYDTAGQLVQVRHVAADATVLRQYDYERGPGGRYDRVTELGGRTVSYDYDASGRLIEERIQHPPRQERVISYSYDAVGNRLSLSDSLLGQTTYVYDANDQLLRAETNGVVTRYAYDANGNLVLESGPNYSVRYNWGVDGRLLGVDINEGGTETTVRYEYDYRGNRIAKSVNGERTRYVVDANRALAQLVEEVSDADEVIASYTYDDAILAVDDGADDRYYLFDGHSGVRAVQTGREAIVNSYDYDAFGRTLDASSIAANSFLYRGERFDGDLGQYYLRARIYDQQLGRFLSEDPEPGSLDAPVTQHRYLYANGNPVLFADPSGRYSVAQVMAGVALTGVIGAISQQAYGIYKAGTLREVEWEGPNIFFSISPAKTSKSRSRGGLQASAGLGFDPGITLQKAERNNRATDAIHLVLTASIGAEASLDDGNEGFLPREGGATGGQVAKAFFYVFGILPQQIPIGVSAGDAEIASQVALGGENGIDPYVALNGFYVQVAASVSAPTLFAAFFDGNNAIGRAGVLQGFAAGYADVDTGVGAAGFSASVGLNGGFSISLTPFDQINKPAP